MCYVLSTGCTRALYFSFQMLRMSARNSDAVFGCCLKLKHVRQRSRATRVFDFPPPLTCHQF